MKKKKETKTFSWGTFVLGALFVVLIIGLFSGGDSDDEPEDNSEKYRKMYEQDVYFCNNTQFLREDSFGDYINGTVYFSYYGTEGRFQEGYPSRIQKGIGYTYWIDSDTHFVLPLEFEADCKNEEDTEPNYVKLETMVRAPENNSARLKIFDRYNWDLEEGILLQEEEEKVYKGYMEVRYYPPSPDTSVMWFGGTMILEYDKHISDIRCQDLSNSGYLGDVVDRETDITRIYYFELINNTAQAYKVTANIDSGEGGLVEMGCMVTVYEQNLEYVEGTEFKFTLIPADFYLTKTMELEGDITKEKEDIFEYVIDRKIEARGRFAVW